MQLMQDLACWRDHEPDDVQLTVVYGAFPADGFSIGDLGAILYCDRLAESSVRDDAKQ